ncbi:hypothetical protein [Photobacterium damselae]|uniref:hypothetical protein n=1 Tax=Photobacterium damselae TaxID=38293 RepID=UPI00165E66B3|nr:hypothetical protein [Photobacterium damselae]
MVNISYFIGGVNKKTNKLFKSDSQRLAVSLRSSIAKRRSHLNAALALIILSVAFARLQYILFIVCVYFVMRKLTKEQRAQRKKSRLERQAKYETVLINDKQVRVKRSPEIDGLSVSEFLRRNDPFYSNDADYLGETEVLNDSDDDFEDIWV